MKACEKELIFSLLKTADAEVQGYYTERFKEMPVFLDDKEEEKSNQKENPIQDESQIQNHFQTQEKIPTQEEKHSSLTLETLAEKIAICKRCPLNSTRTKTVPGYGVKNPEVLVIGEGPGEEEDKQGLPFVGPAGLLLDKMLSAIELDRNANCYIANTVKCRPPYNRDPFTQEADACRSYLDAQIHLLKPKMILALGKVAVRNLLKIEGEFSLNKYRGKIFEYEKIPLVVTYHPSALLRNAEFKKPAWEDLKFFKSHLLTISPNYFVPFKNK